MIIIVLVQHLYKLYSSSSHYDYSYPILRKNVECLPQDPGDGDGSESTNIGGMMHPHPFLSPCFDLIFPQP